DQTDKLVEASMSSLEKSSTAIGDIYKGMNVITQLLKDISNTDKDDHATNQKINESTETFAKFSSHVTEIALKREMFSLRQDTFEIKSIMTERLRYQSLTGNEGEPSYKGEPDTQPMLLSYAYVRAILLSEDEAQESDEKVLAVGDDMDKDHQDDKTALKREMFSLRQDTFEIKSIMTERGENATTTATEEPPSHNEGETEEPRLEIPISSIPSTIIPPTEPITSIIILLKALKKLQ
nr:hypothetical protein [Tanacetum cinerariifolium]